MTGEPASNLSGCDRSEIRDDHEGQISVTARSRLRQPHGISPVNAAVMMMIGTALQGSTPAHAVELQAAEVQLLCTGEVEHQKELTVVLLTHREGKYFAMYPKGSRIETAVNLLHRGEKLTIVGHISDGGLGAWVIHRPTSRFHYGQAKDQSAYSNTPLNADHYFGECILIKGSITEF